MIEVFLLLLIATTITCVSMIIFEGKILEISLWYGWVPLMFGLIMFGPSLYLVEQTGQKYYYLFGLFSSMIGLIISILDFTDVMDGLFMYFFVLGILVLLLGCSKLIWFMHKYPVIDIEEE